MALCNAPDACGDVCSARYAIRWCGRRLLNLDSNLASPEEFDCEEAAHRHIQAVMDRGGHAFLVRRGEERGSEGAVSQP
jgi:hypothetical protein